MKTTTHKTIFTLVTLFFISMFFTSCEKEEDTVGIIQVVYSNGNPMIGATVTLNQTNGAPGTDPIDNLSKSAVTDASGRAEFTYRYEAILDVHVEKTSGNDVYIGNNVIRLLRGKTTTIVVEAVIQ